MLKIGVTGGIGSGKTTVCLLFQQLFNIPVYYADVRAKHIINENQIIKEQIVALFGEDAYLNNEYNRTFIASKVFNNNTLLQQLNAIVHPAVFKDALHFFNKHQSENYVLYEAAILFESGGYKTMDKNILVIAPTELRIERTMNRDGITSDKVKQRIKNQKPDEEKIKLSNFVIVNDGEKDLKSQVQEIHRLILESIK